jgi:hypothetical protein
MGNSIVGDKPQLSFMFDGETHMDTPFYCKVKSGLGVVAVSRKAYVIVSYVPEIQKDVPSKQTVMYNSGIKIDITIFNMPWMKLKYNWFVDGVFTITSKTLEIDNVDVMVNSVYCKVVYGDKEVTSTTCKLVKYVDAQNVRIYPISSAIMGSTLTAVASGSDL